MQKFTQIYSITLLLAIYLLPLSTEAAPAISGSSSGTIGDGQTFTIQGSGFGTKSPAAPLLWETFDGGVSGGKLGGSWKRYDSADSLLYTSTSPYGGSGLSVMNTVSYGDGHNSKFSSATYTFPASNELYYSYMSRHVGASTGGKVFKNGRINTGSNTYSGDGMIAISDGYVFYRPGSSSVYPDDRRFSTVNIGSSNWQRHQIYGKVSNPAGSANGRIFAQVHTHLNDYSNIVSRASGYSFQYRTILLGTMLDQPKSGETHYFYIDDVYVDNTLARVELCSGSTWATRNVCDPQIPTSWSNTSITVRGNSGGFSTGQKAYLYVIDANGSVNQSGRQVSIGTSSGSGSIPPPPPPEDPTPDPTPTPDTTPPAVPTGLRVQ